MTNEKINFQCIQVKQPIGEFYLGAMSAQDLIAISYADVRDIDGRDVDRYLGIQRHLDQNRVKEIQAYVNHKDATFPTGVILAVSSDYVLYDGDKHIMSITKDEGVAKILDGQHRIEGLIRYTADDFFVPIVVFVDMDIAEQANVFSTINLAQTKVNKSLVYDLYEYAKSRSPQKTGHEICTLLNRVETSPFYHRIKVLGVASADKFETLTQAIFVENLLKYITLDAMRDRDLLMRGKPLERAFGASAKRLIFRDMFIDEQDSIIAKVLYDYFSAVGEQFPSAWNSVERGNIFNRSTGFIALMRFLGPCCSNLLQSNKAFTQDNFLSIFSHINMDEGSFTPQNYPPGSSGPKKLYDEMMQMSALDNPGNQMGFAY